MTTEANMKIASGILSSIRDDIGDLPEAEEIWACLGMLIVMWVTWNASRGDKILAVKFAGTFHDQLVNNLSSGEEVLLQ